MQAILTKYIPATNSRPCRIKASCARGSLTISDPRNMADLNEMGAHRTAAQKLCDKFISEDVKEYGSDPATNPWGKPFVSGCLSSGEWAHVFTEGGGAV